MLKMLSAMHSIIVGTRFFSMIDPHLHVGGAFEIMLTLKDPANEICHIALHSKLCTSKFPNVGNIIRRINTILGIERLEGSGGLPPSQQLFQSASNASIKGNLRNNDYHAAPAVGLLTVFARQSGTRIAKYPSKLPRDCRSFKQKTET